jgi:hypothetical protein
VFPYGAGPVQERDVSESLLVLHGVDDALGGQLRDRGAHPDHLHLRDGDPDEVSHQDPVKEDQQPSAIKISSRKTNNQGYQASFGGSLPKNNMEVEAAAIMMELHLDDTGHGVHRVHTIYV